MARKACWKRSEDHKEGQRAGTVGSVIGESAGPGETAETGVGEKR